MSAQGSQRVRRIASPSTKQGPIKATLTFGLKSSPTTTKSCGGPSSSPTQQRGTESHRKTRRSADSRASPDRNSPGSPGFKVDKSSRSSRHSPGPLIRRANSYDTIANTYLKCEWPRLTSEKATQTEEWEESAERKKTGSHKRSSSLGNGDNTKEKIKARLAKTVKESVRGSAGVVGAGRASPVAATHAALGATTPVFVATVVLSKAVCIPHIPKGGATVRGVVGSVEGLNQEIEKLVLLTTTEAEGEIIAPIRTREPTPDGHRAPIFELLLGGAGGGALSGAGVGAGASTTRTAVTQTPSALVSEPSRYDDAADALAAMSLVHVVIDEHASLTPGGSTTTSSSSSSSRSQSASPSLLPIIAGLLDAAGSRPSSRPESDGKDKDCNDSLSFVREPPDGCEKVVVEEARVAPPSRCELFFEPIKKLGGRCRIPSRESAFCQPLFRSYVSQPAEMSLRVPSSASSSISPSPPPTLTAE